MAPVVRRVLIGSMAVMSIVSVVAIFMFAFQCRPLSVAWGVGTGTCLPGSTIANVAYMVSAADILFSWLYGVSILILSQMLPVVGDRPESTYLHKVVL